jgi:phospholipid transport system substrate-binding protein
MMKKQFIIMMLCLTGFFANAAPTDNPYELVQEVANATLKRIKQDNQSIQKDPEQLKVVLREQLMPYVNHKLAAKMVLGKTVATAEQKNAFYQAFEAYLVVTYASIFRKYVDQQLVIEKGNVSQSKNEANKKVVTVKTRLVDGKNPDIHIGFKVRLQGKSGKWAVYDMVVEGVSLLDSKKAELRTILRQQNGIEVATGLLTEKAKNSVAPTAIVPKVSQL